MKVAIVGSGRLARELLEGLDPSDGTCLHAWGDVSAGSDMSVVVHAGSGRELAGVVAYCERAQATLLELATGSTLENSRPSFPVVLCPNTNILMLKFMSMVETGGPMFRDYQVSIQESHQSGKISAPGTALALAQSLGLPPEAIESVRDRQRQSSEFAVPANHLDRHAIHRISIRDAGCAIYLEARVLDAAPYVRGVGQLLRALQTRRLAPGLHAIGQLIQDGWL